MGRKTVYKSRSGKVYNTAEEAKRDSPYSIVERGINTLSSIYNTLSNAIFSNDNNTKTKQISVAKKSKPKRKVVNNNPYNYSTRIRDNNSRSQELSEKFEHRINEDINWNKHSKNYNKNYDIPYTGKTIILNGMGVDIGGLDSIAKYAYIHNRNPRFPQYEKPNGKTPKRVSLEEAVGLPFRETVGGRTPYLNTGQYKEKKEFLKDLGYNTKNIDNLTLDNAVMNTNYIRNYGSVPAANYVRDFRYVSDTISDIYPEGNTKMINKNTPPLLHALQYYANGNYNPGSPSHSRDTRESGKTLLEALKKYPRYYQEVMDFYTGKRTK